MTRRAWVLRSVTAPAICLILLAGIWVQGRVVRATRSNLGDYHARVRAAAARLPYHIGQWVGRDVDPPSSAVALLKPNVLLGREYTNAATGEHATLILIQCQDARDMSGHWPPNCYVAHGWKLRDTTRGELLMEDSRVPVAVYRFTTESLDHFDEIIVYNFFVRPDGSIESGGEGKTVVAVDRRFKSLGAGQFQIVFEPSMAVGRRDAVSATLLDAAQEVIECIRGGGA